MPDTTSATDSRPANRIDADDDAALHEWAAKLDVSPDQVREAVQAVGNHADDVEMHLKGSRSTTNSERTAGEA